MAERTGGQLLVDALAHQGVRTIFGIPGMGRATVTAIFQRDYPVIQAVVMLYTGLFLILNLLTDLGYALLDPRIRYAD